MTNLIVAFYLQELPGLNEGGEIYLAFLHFGSMSGIK